MSERIEKDDLIAVERYKFILEKIKYLDSLHHAHFNFVYKIIISLASFVIAVAFLGIEGKVEIRTVIFSIKSPGLVMTSICLFFLAMSRAILSSWRDYRIEEVELLRSIDTKVERSMPSNGFSWRWNEVQFMLLLLVLSLVGLGLYIFPESIVELYSNK